jgi:hypothetical protein
MSNQQPVQRMCIRHSALFDCHTAGTYIPSIVPASVLLITSTLTRPSRAVSPLHNHAQQCSTPSASSASSPSQQPAIHATRACSPCLRLSRRNPRRRSSAQPSIRQRVRRLRRRRPRSSRAIRTLSPDCDRAGLLTSGA